MGTYYNETELESDRTYRFIRDLDLPADSNRGERKSDSKRMKKDFGRDSDRKNIRRQDTVDPKRSRKHRTVSRFSPLKYSEEYPVEKPTASQYNDLNTRVYNPEKNIAVSQYNELITRAYNTEENIAVSQYNELNTRIYNTEENIAVSQYNELNTRVYNTEENITVPQYDQEVRVYETEKTTTVPQFDKRVVRINDPGENAAASQYNLYDTYSNGEIQIIENPSQDYAAPSVWDIVDPKGTLRGVSANVPEAPVFSTGVVQQTEDVSQSLNLLQAELAPVIRYSEFKLYAPQKPDVTKPEVQRPPGCKTVSVSGLPLRVKEDMVKEMFKQCGKIVRCRLRTPSSRKKHECIYHVTFLSERNVDSALELSGYRVVIRDRLEKAYCGIIHIDFVPVLSEQLAYEHRSQREVCHKNDPGSSSSASRIGFKHSSVADVVDRLKDEESFREGIELLVECMEEGKCNEKTVYQYFNTLQTMQGFVSRLMKDTAKVEEDVHQSRSKLNAKYATNSLHFIAILKAFNVALSPGVWQHFSKTQRNRINMWKKHVEEIKESNSKDLLSGRVEEKMCISDDENSLENSPVEELRRLQKENECLKKELKAAQVKTTEKNVEPKQFVFTEKEDADNANLPNKSDGFLDSKDLSAGFKITSTEARLIALIGAFLKFHRYGEHLESISRYLSKMHFSTSTKDIECLLRKFPSVFNENIQEKKWVFSGI